MGNPTHFRNRRFHHLWTQHFYSPSLHPPALIHLPTIVLMCIVFRWTSYSVSQWFLPSFLSLLPAIFPICITSHHRNWLSSMAMVKIFISRKDLWNLPNLGKNKDLGGTHHLLVYLACFQFTLMKHPALLPQFFGFISFYNPCSCSVSTTLS